MTYIAAELCRIIGDRANNRCEYCRIPDSHTFDEHEIDHIYAENMVVKRLRLISA